MKDFALGAAAVAALWWLLSRKHPCGCRQATTATTAAQTPDSAATTIPGSPEAVGGLLPGMATIPEGITMTAPAAELDTSIVSAQSAQSAPTTAAPGPINLTPSGGMLPSGTVGPSGLKPILRPMPARQTWNIG